MPIIPNGTTPKQHEVKAVLARLERLGADPSEARSCLPSAGMRGFIPNVKGCNCYDKCPFGQRRFGGFKGDGPKRVKVYLNPNDGTRHQQELAFNCYDYVRLMLERQKSGVRDREEGKRGEIISVVGGEPGVIIPGADTKHMHVCRTMVMEKEGGADDRSPNPKFVKRVKEIPITPFEYGEKERGDEFSNALENQYMRMEQHNTDSAFGSPQLPDVPSAPAFDLGEDDEPVVEADLELATPVAEPVERKRGR